MTAALIEPRAVQALHSADRGALIIDVRTASEFTASHIARSRSVPLENLDPLRLWSGAVCLSTPITVVCDTGARSCLGAERLSAAGFETVGVLKGGLRNWVAAGLPVGSDNSHQAASRSRLRIAFAALVALGGLLAWLVAPFAILISVIAGLGLLSSDASEAYERSTRPGGPATDVVREI